MTPLLEKAIERVRALPRDEQDAIAARILDSVADEDVWARQFREKRERLRQLAREASEEDGRCETHPLDELV